MNHSLGLPEPPPNEPQRPAVLLVDDNSANLLALGALLASPTVEVLAAKSGREALAHLQDREFALVLMDVQMPELDGFQTTELIRQRDRTRNTAVIFVTAKSTDRESAQRAYALGALDYVIKPFDSDLLKAKVSALVDSHRQAAQAANRLKDDFLAMVSHELRAPLNAILGWAAALEFEKDLSPKAAMAAQTIARSARAQSSLIDRLLDVSSIVANGFKLDSRVVDLRALAQSAIDTLGASAAAKQVAVRFGVGEGNYATVGDAVRLQELVSDLLANAIKFSNPGGHVALELTRDDRRFRLRVADDGIGVASEFLPHMFERFRQCDGSRIRTRGGLGIGLTLARHITVLHGGTIEASSAGPGKGTALLVTLPTRDGELASHRPGPPAPPVTGSAGGEALPSLAGLSVLVVDDDEDARELLGTLIADAGGQLVKAASAAEAVALFERGAFDAVVSDLGMPAEDGASLVRKIRALESERGGRAVVVALSGYGSGEDRRHSQQAGFDVHLTKPCEPSILLSVLARLARRP